MNRIMLDTATKAGNDLNPCIVFVRKQPEHETWIIFQYGDGCWAVCLNLQNSHKRFNINCFTFQACRLQS